MELMRVRPGVGLGNARPSLFHTGASEQVTFWKCYSQPGGIGEGCRLAQRKSVLLQICGSAESVLLGFHDHAFNPAIRHKPDERDGDVKSVRDPRTDKGQWNRGKVKDRRQFAFPILPDCRGEE